MTGNNTVSRRRFLQATGGAASALALAGCTGGPDEETETEAPQDTETEAPQDTETETEAPDQGKTLQLINGTITTFDPVAATDTASGRVIQNVYDALMNYPNGMTAVENLLAADFTLSEDFKTYTFDIEDATYHDGRSVKAGDFEYAFKRLAFSEKSRRSYFILSSMGVVNPSEGELGVTAVDDSTLEVELKSPFHSTLEMLAYTSFSAVPEGIVGDLPGYDGEMEYNEWASQNPIGAGPFVFEKWTQGTEVDVTRYADYHGDVAQIAGIHWQVIEDSDAAYNYAMNKNADRFGLPTSKYDPSLIKDTTDDEFGRTIGKYGPMRNGVTANYVKYPTLSFFYVGFNMEKVPKPVRQAFAYAMNQDLMVEQIFKSRGQAAYHVTPPAIYPGGGLEYTKHAKQYPYGYNKSDLESARQVMEDAGYGPDNRFEVQWTQYTSPTWEEMAKLLRDQLASAHIDMKIEQAEFATLLQRGRTGALEAYTLGWIADWPEADNFVQLINPPQTDTDLEGPISYTNWSEETGDAADEASAAWQTIVDNPAPTKAAGAARDKAYVKMEEANWEDVSFLTVYHRADEAFWYDWLDVPIPGPMGASRQKYNHGTIGERN